MDFRLALIMFFVCIVIMCVITFFTRPVPLDLLGALTWKTLNKPRFRESAKSAEYVVSADMKLEDVKFDNGMNFLHLMFTCGIESPGILRCSHFMRLSRALLNRATTHYDPL